ncbi:MAG TPA: acyl-CoA dehydrogenase family protein [Amycolatopsis sp.]|nr:acyl-CoA dehydrogenase family protein [Amycolatopsis sp.]
MPADALVSAAELSAEFTHWLTANRARATELSDAALRPAPALDYLAAQKALQSWLHDEGWLARGWPKEYGGTGNDVGLRAAIYDLLGAADITVPTTVNIVEILAPTLRRFAPGLAERMLPPLVAGAEAWCQGFSEPEAGSDLASLRMRATRTGEGWSLTGQKIWSTRAAGADRCTVLVRTGSPESRHRGLSMFLVDMDTPGVQCRPIDDMSFTQHFGEIFFDDVRIPDERRIGEVDGGWAVAQYLLQWERGMFAWLRQAALLGMLRRLPEADDPGYGAAYQDVIALRLRSLGTLRALSAGRSDGPQVSIDKLLLSRAERSVHELAHRIQPVGVDDATADWEGRVHEYLHSRSAPIYGGSAEIQRTIIATQILQLGREAR